MTETNASDIRASRLPLPKAVGIPVVVVLVLFFILLGFPWDTLARRVAWEISAASGSSVSIETLAPALTGRGPVLRALDVVIEHPAIDRLRLFDLEIAPRFSTSWFRGEPALRIWVDTELGLVDGVLGVGETSSFVGRVQRVELTRLPLRLDATGINLSGQLDADVDVAFDRDGTLRGRISFVSPSLVVESTLLPLAIPFSHAEGVIVIRPDGATQIESVVLEGKLVKGKLSGEIGLVHRSQPPPIDLDVELSIVDPTLRRMAPGAGIPVSPTGELALKIGGTLNDPEIVSSPTPIPQRGAARRRSRRNRR